MELITHNLVAVIIQILCFRYFIFPLSIILTIIFAYISHLVVDALAKITYHTPDAHTDDKFWVVWHIIVYSISLVSLIVFIVPFWLAILFANLIDITDWFILRPIRNWRTEAQADSSKGNLWYAHKQADWIRDKFFFWLPNWNHKYVGVSIEIIIIISLSLIIFFII
jgi:hypothetical protein